MSKRVVVVVNKWWECDLLLNVLLHDQARPAALKDLWPVPLYHPRRRPAPPNTNPMGVPRATYQLGSCRLEVWCVSDLIEREAKEFQSSTQTKWEKLPAVFAPTAPDLVIAVGTAASPFADDLNGTVAVGTGVYMYNAYPNGDNKFSKWDDPRCETLVNSTLTPEAFGQLTTFTAADLAQIGKRFVLPPLHHSSYLADTFDPACGRVRCQHDFVALATLNVTDYGLYKTYDPKTLASYQSGQGETLAKSLETTHCLIRCRSEAPFLWVSGLANPALHFDDQNTPREYAQNLAAAHNAGVVVAWMIPLIDQWAQGNL
ncbi:MAG: hypothetical protein WCP21_01650 [Armatimonadota bacterium]